MLARAIGCAVLGCALLAGCSELKNEFADRYGPDPVLLRTEVADTVDRPAMIMEAFYQAAASRGTPSWFNAAEVGINYVDEKCDAYMSLTLANFARAIGRARCGTSDRFPRFRERS